MSASENEELVAELQRMLEVQGGQLAQALEISLGFDVEELAGAARS